MVNFLSATDMSLGDAALYSVVGFAIVLGVLAILVGIFYLSGFLFRTKTLSKEKLFERKKKPQVSDDTEPQEDDDELVAAITAAISVVLSQESGESEAVPEFVIRRITRKK